MKLTLNRKEKLKAKIKKYCDLLQVEYPNIIATRKVYEEFKKYLRANKGCKRVGRTVSRVFGVWHPSEKVVFVNMKKSPNLNRLDKTVRHELLHYAKPSYNHKSTVFQDRLNRLKKGYINNGRFC